ncbi:MAG TPA: hypothetical protein VM122_08060 [Usitatibacter sp.]|nr:hypothetical protein [Usitatibacter sp.]
MKPTVRQDTPRVVAVAVIFFGALAGLGWVDGVYSRLETEAAMALALFALAFAAGTYTLDHEVRAWVNGSLRLRTGTAKSPGAKRAAT